MTNASTTNVPVATVLIIFGALAVFYLLVIWGVVRIIRRSGYSGWWVLAGLVPVLNLVMFFLFAFTQAPTERELKQLRAWAASTGGPGRPGPWG